MQPTTPKMNSSDNKGSNKKAEPFARMFKPWWSEMVSNKCSATEFGVMLSLCSRLELDEKGRAYAWYPRNEMAEELQRSETTIKQAVRTLSKRGYLKVKTRGFKSHCTEYWVFPTMPVQTTKVQRGTPLDTPKNSKGYLTVSQRGTPLDTPLLNKDGLSPSNSRAKPSLP